MLQMVLLRRNSWLDKSPFLDNYFVDNLEVVRKMDDPMQYKNNYNWMRYATAEEIDAHFKALEHQKKAAARGEAWATTGQSFGGSNKDEDIETRLLRGSHYFPEAMDLTKKTLGDQGGNRTKLIEELGYFGSSRLGYEYYHACRVIYRIGVEAEEMWRKLYGRKTPQEELLDQAENGTLDERNPRDEQIFDRLKKAIEEEVADRPGCTPGRDGGLRYIFNIEYILQNDLWTRDVQRKLTSMNQWTNAMMYAYDKILEKLYRVDRCSFEMTVNRHDNFRGHGYWDNGEYVALEDKIKEYPEKQGRGEK